MTLSSMDAAPPGKMPLCHKGSRHMNITYQTWLLPLLYGIIVGVAIATTVILYPNNFFLQLLKADAQVSRHQDFVLSVSSQKVDRQQTQRTTRPEVRVRKPIYVGVMTAHKFLHTRATACNQTWGKDASKLEFFAQTGSWEKYHLPIVNLPDVDDSVYPPQQKVFRMMQYMCDNYIDEYDWFMRADDDVYVKMESLLQFLHTVDSTKQLYIGQPGEGLPHEKHKLGLKGGNFCMGGPGVIFSRPALLGLCPHISQCMRDVVSDQEDVEIGRCVTTHLGIQCTRSWQMLKLFYHAYDGDYDGKPFVRDLTDDQHFTSAITLHYAKQPYVMHNLHYYHLQEQLQAAKNEIKYYKHLLEMLEAHSKIGQNLPEEDNSVVPPSGNGKWTFFDRDSVYSADQCRQSIKGHVLQDLQQAVEEAVDQIHSQTRQQQLELSHFMSGYYRIGPNKDTEYIVDLMYSSETRGKIHKRVHLARKIGYPITIDKSVINSVATKLALILPLGHNKALNVSDTLSSWKQATLKFLAKEPQGSTAFVILIPYGHLSHPMKKEKDSHLENIVKQFGQNDGKIMVEVLNQEDNLTQLGAFRAGLKTCQDYEYTHVGLINAGMPAVPEVLHQCCHGAVQHQQVLCVISKNTSRELKPDTGSIICGYVSDFEPVKHSDLQMTHSKTADKCPLNSLVMKDVSTLTVMTQL